MGLRVRTAAAALGAAALVLSGVGVAMATGAVGGNNDKTSGTARQLKAGPGINIDEGVFTPITPCRIVDTRVHGGAVSAARSFYVAGTANFPAQGGKSGGCGIPSGAKAVSANIVATGSTKSGFIKGYPAGLTAPSASIINFAAKQTIANGLSLAVRPGTSTGLTLSASSPVQVVIDVTGYYSEQITAFINSGGSIGTGTTRVLSVTHPSTGLYTVAVDRNIFSCSATVTPADAGHYASALTSTATVDVHLWSLSSTASVVAADGSFNITITC